MSLVDAEGRLRTIESDLRALELGEEGIEEEMARIRESIEYKKSQMEFYDDGVVAVERLYKICVHSLANKQRRRDDSLLEVTRARTLRDTKSASVGMLESEMQVAQAENDRIKDEWATSQGEVKLMVEKKRNEKNRFFGSIRNDFEALREWRKFQYFEEMVDRLKKQLEDEGRPFRAHRADILYGAVLKTRTPLREWVDFVCARLLQEGSDAESPVELDQDSEKVQQMIEFLRERARLVEGRTWPNGDV